jgi:Sphingosine kinase and enzymes related to eukaryotic diacylglycerol kinase
MAISDETTVARTGGQETRSQTVWLVCNAASGSNNQAAVRAVREALAEAGLDLAKVVPFPDESLPGPELLASNGVDILAVFGGDGTIHSAIETATEKDATPQWRGAVLPLPGGTMNMLSKRLHGDVPAPEIVARLGSAPPRRVRPPVIQTSKGIALTGVLAGPGAVWNEVREAMRAMDVIQFVNSAREAIVQSASGPKVLCDPVDGGREEGYAAITVTPRDDGLETKGYYAETLGDYAGQGIALLNRDYRQGPHDHLGRHGKVRLFCPEGEPMGMLIDGEPFDGGSEELFETVPCAVELIATASPGPDDAR